MVCKTQQRTRFATEPDALCVVRLDRVGRSLRELLETVDQLKARGIGLVSIEEKIDTSSATGELVFHVFGAIAHFKRRLIAERTKAAARARGKRLGLSRLTRTRRKPRSNSWRQGFHPRRLRANLALGGPRSTAKSRQRAFCYVSGGPHECFRVSIERPE